MKKWGFLFVLLILSQTTNISFSMDLTPEDQQECLDIIAGVMRSNKAPVPSAVSLSEKNKSPVQESNITEIILTHQELNMLDKLLYFNVEHLKQEISNGQGPSDSSDTNLLAIAKKRLIQSLNQQRVSMESYESYAQEEGQVFSPDTDLVRAASSTVHVQKYFQSKTDVPEQDLVNAVMKDLPEGVDPLLSDIISGSVSVRAIFNGKPGTGKTTLAKVIARESCKPFRFDRIAAMKNSYEASDIVALINSLMSIIAQNKRYVIILDEINNLIRNNHIPNEQRQASEQDPVKLLCQLLDDCLKKPAITILATTNDVDLLPEVLRSRFKTITVPQLSANRRYTVLKYRLTHATMTVDKKCLDDILLKQLADRLRSCTARQINDFVRDAESYARARHKEFVESTLPHYSQDDTQEIVGCLEKQGFSTAITKGAIRYLFTKKINETSNFLLPSDLEVIISQQYPSFIPWLFRGSTWSGFCNESWKFTKGFAKNHGPIILQQLAVCVAGNLLIKSIGTGKQTKIELPHHENIPMYGSEEWGQIKASDIAKKLKLLEKKPE